MPSAARSGCAAIRLASLAAEHGYEGTVAVMWEGFAGNGLTRAAMREALAAARVAAFARIGEWLDCAARRPLREGVRIALAALPDEATPAQILATLPVAIAALLRAGAGEPPVAPDPSLATAADLLRMIADATAEPRRAAALDTYLTTVIDNGLGNSHLRGARRGLEPGFARRGGTGRLLRVWRPAAWRRTRPRCRHARRDRGERRHRRLDRAQAGGRWPPHGIRSSRLPPSRPARRLAARGAAAARSRAARLDFVIDVERRAVAALQRRKPGRRVEANIEMDAAMLLGAIGLPREAFTPVFATGALRGLAGACHGAEADRPHDPAGVDLYRPIPAE